VGFKQNTTQALAKGFNVSTGYWEDLYTDAAHALLVAFAAPPTVIVSGMPPAEIAGNVMSVITDPVNPDRLGTLYAGDSDTEDVGTAFGLQVNSRGYGWNTASSAWERIRLAVASADSEDNGTESGQRTNGRTLVWNETDGYWQRVQAGLGNGDLLDNGTKQGLYVNTRLHGWQTDNSTWFRIRATGVNCLCVTLFGNDGTDVWVLGAPGDSLGSPNAMAVLGFNYLWDPGTSQWNRARGDTTNGAWVNVKAAAQLPASLGSQLSAASLSVVFASDMAGLPISGTVDQGDPAAEADAWPVYLTDGTNAPAVNDSTPLTTAWGLVVRISGGPADFATGFPSAGFAAGFSDGTAMQGARVFDLDSGVGNQWVLGANLRFTGAGGGTEAGTASAPLRVDPTGTTAQPVSDNAGSLTVDTPQLPATLGQKVMAGSLAVVLASDQSAVPVSGSVTVSGTVTANQGTAAAPASAWLVRLTDGSNYMPTMDTVARRGFVSITDGSNVMPTMDAATRRGYFQLTDGTNSPVVTNAAPASNAYALVVRAVGAPWGAFGSALPANGSASGYYDGTNLQAARVYDLDSGAGAHYCLGVTLRRTASGTPVELIGQAAMAASIPVVIASDQSAVNVGSIAGAITPGTGATNLGKAEDAAHSSGDVGVMALGVVNTTHTARAGANGDYVPIATDLEGDVLVTGSVAHDAVDADAPIKIGGQARSTNRTKVADADRADIITDLNGRIITEPFGPRELDLDGNITLTTTAETTLIAAGGAGVFHDLIGLLLTNTSGSSVRVDIRDTTAGTVQFSVWVANANSFSTTFIPFPRPVKQTTANTNWTAQLSSNVTDVRIFAQVLKRN
jgi:hypothetical protein